MPLIGDGPLSRQKLADVLKLFAGWCEGREYIGYCEAMEAAATSGQIFNRALTASQVEQVTEAVAMSLPTGGPNPREVGPLSAITSFLSAQGKPHALYVLLVEAWMVQEAIAQTEPQYGQLPPLLSPVEQAMQELKLPGWYALLAYDTRTGRRLQPERILGLALAAAGLCELVLLGHAHIRNGWCYAGSVLTQDHAGGISNLAEMIHRELGRRPSTVDVLAGWTATSPEMVRGELIGAGLLERRSWRLLGIERATHLATSPLDVHLLRASVTRPLERGETLPAPKAVLFELVRATGLAVARPTEWSGLIALPPLAGLAHLEPAQRIQLGGLLRAVAGEAAEITLATGL
jgi:hypothetical protein